MLPYSSLFWIADPLFQPLGWLVQLLRELQQVSRPGDLITDQLIDRLLADADAAREFRLGDFHLLQAFRYAATDRFHLERLTNSLVMVATNCLVDV